jgi:hypothetical protein
MDEHHFSYITKLKKKTKTLQVKTSWLGFTGIRAPRQRAGVEPFGNFGAFKRRLLVTSSQEKP